MSTVARAGLSSTVVPPARRLGMGTMLAYAFGAVAYGVKDNGFGTFLLLFYNQVIGLPAQSVGLVIALALILDGLIDPAVGFLSDRTRTRWGRRHPWMYASVIPIAIGWMLVWHPPVMGHSATLVWLFVGAVVVRSAVSAYEVPSVALTSELSSDYDERTRIMAYRYLLGWAGGLAILFAAYAFFLRPNPVEAGRGGFLAYGIGSGVMIVVAILISGVGTHHEIGRLPQPGVERHSLATEFRALGGTVRNRGFAVLMAAGLCVYTAQGVNYALSNYLYSYVWRFSTGAFTMLALTLLLAAAIAFVLAPRLGRRFGKPRAAAALAVAATGLLVLPYILRLGGLFPAPGDARMLPLLFTIFTVNGACSISAMILGASMMADVVEDAELKTGKRSEGIFFAGAFFVQKCTSGLGIFFASAMIAAAGLLPGSRPDTVAPAVVDRLTILFVIAYVVLGLGGAFFYTRFPFGRVEHEGRLARLRAARG